MNSSNRQVIDNTDSGPQISKTSSCPTKKFHSSNWKTCITKNKQNKTHFLLCFEFHQLKICGSVLWKNLWKSLSFYKDLYHILDLASWSAMQGIYYLALCGKMWLLLIFGWVNYWSSNTLKKWIIIRWGTGYRLTKVKVPLWKRMKKGWAEVHLPPCPVFPLRAHEEPLGRRVSGPPST